MTGSRTGPDDSPAWSLELLADLHAGALSERAAARLRSAVATDPPAGAVLAALDATVADLAALPAQCPARMPDAVAQRLDAALAAEASRAVPARRARGARRLVVMPATRLRWIGAGVLAAGVLAIAAAGLTTSELISRPGDALGAAAVARPVPLVLSGGDLGGVPNRVLGAREYGPLSRPETLRRCLDANDVPAGDKPLGAREVTLDGRPGVILALPTAHPTQLQLLVVGFDCGPGNPARLATTTAPRR
ncbi:MAG: hypothetical protein ACRDSR_20340 [Pseudonocardiaceae bacterium]